MPLLDPDRPARLGRGNSNDHLRRHNLSVILELVHRNGGLSRSQLTQQTGLNRSTIAALAAELVALGLAVEADPDPDNRVGRPSPIVLPGPRMAAISVNPEVDAVTVGAIALGGSVLWRKRYPVEHPPSVHEVVDIAAEAVVSVQLELDPHYRMLGIGAAIPGLVRAGDGLVRLAPHLGWRDEPFAELLAKATGIPVAAANDAHLGTRAESVFGAGRGIPDLIYLNGGASGIGGGIISGGIFLKGDAGYTGELGHTLVNSAGSGCHCGATGCLETEVRRDRLLELVDLCDSDVDDLQRALSTSTNSAVGVEVRRQLDFLAVALRNAINLLNPARIVLGGFLAALYAADPAHLEASLAEQPLLVSRQSVQVVPAKLGSELLLIGAAELVFEALIADPAAVGADEVS